MFYTIQQDILVVHAETGHLVARVRGSDEAGWMAMSVTDRGLNTSVLSGHKFRSLREALYYRVLPERHKDLEAALKSAGLE